MSTDLNPEEKQTQQEFAVGSRDNKKPTNSNPKAIQSSKKVIRPSGRAMPSPTYVDEQLFSRSEMSMNNQLRQSLVTALSENAENSRPQTASISACATSRSATRQWHSKSYLASARFRFRSYTPSYTEEDIFGSGASSPDVFTTVGERINLLNLQNSPPSPNVYGGDSTWLTLTGREILSSGLFIVGKKITTTREATRSISRSSSVVSNAATPNAAANDAPPSSRVENVNWHSLRQVQELS